MNFSLASVTRALGVMGLTLLFFTQCAAPQGGALPTGADVAFSADDAAISELEPVGAAPSQPLLGGIFRGEGAREDVMTGSSRAPAAAAPSSTAKYREVEVYYATDRNRTGNANVEDFYGPLRNRKLLIGSPVEYGKAVVAIPPNHREGVIEGPRWYQFEFSSDPTRHVTVVKLEPKAATAYFTELNAAVQAAPQSQALLFVHGFNVKFNDAVRRTAQMAFDLKFPGVAMTYSWPSNGSMSPLDYTADEDDAEWTVPHLAQVLVDLQRQTNVEKVHIIAHSMGARVLSQALAEARDRGFNRSLNNVILAAPDIDADVFKERILPRIQGMAGRLTMYSSSGDTALLVSRTVNGNDRLGLSGENLVVMTGLDTVDASGVDTSFIGHSYFGSQGKIVKDLFRLMVENKAPPARGLTHRTRGEWGF